MAPAAGASATVVAVVSDADTAIALGSGDVNVLGTPRVLALAERATVAAVAGALEPGTTTVGSRVELEHLRPSPLGSTVRAEATLVGVSGRRLTFDVTVTQDGTTVARGTVRRVVVSKDGFG
jgi:predicted thioesterase